MTHQERLRYAAKWQLDDEAECAALAGAEALDIVEALADFTICHRLDVDTKEVTCFYCGALTHNHDGHKIEALHPDDCLYARAVKLMEDHRG